MKLRLIQKNVNYLKFLILFVGILFISGCIGQQPTVPPSEKIIFTLPAELVEAREGSLYSHSFCEPDSARSGATCGGLAGETTNPYGGNPPYSFSHQFGSGFIPPGLALELNGLLRGTPTLAGNYTFGVCARDTGGNEKCQTTSLTVNPMLEEQVSPSVKIESATVKLKEELPYQLTCTVEMSGTITGPERSMLWVAWGTGEPGILLYPIECPDWNYLGTSGICVRYSDAPATTRWSITSDYLFIKGKGTEFFAVLETDLGDETWDSVILNCG